MNTEESKNNATREQLTKVRNGLFPLHKALLNSERQMYERSAGRIETPAAFLQLLLEDPWFAWLRTLSTLMVKIDERLDDKKNPLGEQEALALIAEAKEMLTPDENGEGFARFYHAALQRDPEVVIKHVEVSKALG